VPSDSQVGSALDDWPWLEGLKSRLASLREVPWERREIDRHIDRQLGETWGPNEARPPAETGRDRVDYLVEVGIFRARAEPALVRGAVFHAQQAAEKAWKAFLAAHERPFRKTHDLDELGSAAAEGDATLDAFRVLPRA
jgi:hypothetical protein